MEVPRAALAAASEAFKGSDAVGLFYGEYHVDALDPAVDALVEEVVRAALGALPADWATLATDGTVFTCRDEAHARGMVQSRSPVLGPWEGRRVASRPRLPWKES